MICNGCWTNLSVLWQINWFSCSVPVILSMFFCWMNMNWMWSEEISWNNMNCHYWVVVSNIFYFHPYLGKWSNLINIVQRGWFNHQLDYVFNQWLFILFFLMNIEASWFNYFSSPDLRKWSKLTNIWTNGGGKKKHQKHQPGLPVLKKKTSQIMDLLLTWPMAKL